MLYPDTVSHLFFREASNKLALRIRRVTPGRAINLVAQLASQ